MGATNQPLEKRPFQINTADDLTPVAPIRRVIARQIHWPWPTVVTPSQSFTHDFNFIITADVRPTSQLFYS
jgi:hypothetical protein